jgi:hypothetical protein
MRSLGPAGRDRRRLAGATADRAPYPADRTAPADSPAAYPKWDDELLFQRDRLIAAAQRAKIHTVEWTPAVVAHPTLVTALHCKLVRTACRRRHNWAFPARPNSAGCSTFPSPDLRELTDNPDWSRELADVYRGHIDRVDLLCGMFAEVRPEGFAFSGTAFRIFVLTASRRLNSSRFLTVDFTPAVYTPEGMQWIDEAPLLTSCRATDRNWHLPSGQRSTPSPCGR